MAMLIKASMPTVLGMVAVYSGASHGVSAVAVSLEDAVALAAKQVSQETNGMDWSLLEMWACHHDPDEDSPLLEQEPMTDLGQVEYVNAIFVPPEQNEPHIEATIDLRTSPPSVTLEVHDFPFLQDSRLKAFPPASGITFAQAHDQLLAAFPGTTVVQALFRKPVQPCVSEDLFIFVVSADLEAKGSIVTVGAQNGRVCQDFVTEDNPMPMCADAVCFDWVATV